MKRKWALRLCASAVLCASSVCNAQTPPSDGFDHTYDDIIGPQKLPDLFDPEKHGMERIRDPASLFELLTRKGRCEIGKTVKSGVPCAFISYAPVGTRLEAYRESLRPVFKVENEGRIWTYLNSRLSLVTIEHLLHVDDLTDASAPERQTLYDPTALVGYAENQANCKQSGREACVDTEQFLIFNQKRLLTAGCVDEIWNKRGGATGSGHQSRCRFDVPQQ